ncbi:MAG TPA: hypothetical protein VFI61_02575 [Patescibacteria group bacterium]|nr:hypothetical protein [Patescibacteria group bacterium]
MEISLAQKAVSAALNGDWKLAVKINLEIINLDQADIEALNRLARAYAEIGKINLAKETTLRVLKIDPINQIAVKCLERWKSIKSGAPNHKSKLSAESFLEEPGKTKIISLYNLGDAQILASLNSGDEVKLLPHPHSVGVVTLSGKQIGKLPDDLAARLNLLIKNGNKYQTLIKSVDVKDVTVFIREIERSTKQAKSASFPTERIDYVAFTPPELIHKDEPIMQTLEESIEE